MLELKRARVQDAEKIYEAISKMPPYENGFENVFYNMSREEFIEKGIYMMLDSQKGINLKPFHVPQTYYFLWDDEQIVGLFKLRHYLNIFLREGGGHIGFGIINEYRGRHYASEGLRLALRKAKEIIREDTVYMSCFKYNRASLQAMLSNGAYIDHEDEEIYYTRVKIR